MTSKHFSRSDINLMEQRYRANFVNCLSGYKSANLVGSISNDGGENLAVISSVVHLGANPPLLGMVIRPHSVRRDTLENIQQTKIYTINHVPWKYIRQAHQTSARYDQAESEFDETGLNSEYIDDFLSPYVKESPIKVGMTLVEIIPISQNDTLFIIGEIQHVYLSDDIVSGDGFIQLAEVDVACISGLDSYSRPNKNIRYTYAKKGVDTEELV